MLVWFHTLMIQYSISTILMRLSPVNRPMVPPACQIGTFPTTLPCNFRFKLYSAAQKMWSKVA